ncbi:hypothetical protein MHJ95_01520 [Corynebacterium imitans]|uniref:hypothetical protein n=1 Tax=Corynebacterium imitans TaxID=156978 RepID=UPI001EF2D767|nr:hypothetical protein [Corynebacterium imitans]MCG7277672.1 hypothetical protein [Corynebacterium imitans]
MRNFRTAAVATATALTVAISGTAIAQADEKPGEETQQGSTSEGKQFDTREETKQNGVSPAFQSGKRYSEDDKELGQVISDGTKGLFGGKGSSQYVSDNDRDKKFYGVDAFGKETQGDALPQWARLWIDGTIVAGIGALVGLVIAGFNFASYNGLIKL